MKMSNPNKPHPDKVPDKPNCPVEFNQNGQLYIRETQTADHRLPSIDCPSDFTLSLLVLSLISFVD